MLRGSQDAAPLSVVGPFGTNVELWRQGARHENREIALRVDGVRGRGHRAGLRRYSPSKICLFTYENNTFITRSYQPGRTRYKIVVKKAAAKLFDLRTGAELRGYVDGNTTVFEVLQMPRTYTAYRFE